MANTRPSGDAVGWRYSRRISRALVNGTRNNTDYWRYFPTNSVEALNPVLVVGRSSAYGLRISIGNTGVSACLRDERVSECFHVSNDS